MEVNGPLHRSEVEPLSKESQTNSGGELCPCGCETLGRLRKKVTKDGTAHVDRCPCRRCAAPRYKQRASRRERKIGADFGGKRNPGSGAWGGVDTIDCVIDIEETANVTVTRGFRRWWESKTVTNKVATLMSRNIRPRALILAWDGKPRATVMPYADSVQLAEAAMGVCHHCGRKS